MLTQWSCSGWAFSPTLCCFVPLSPSSLFPSLSLKIAPKGAIPLTVRTTVINRPTMNVRWSASKTRTSCLMIIVENSNVRIWPLHAPLYNFSIIRITTVLFECNGNFRFFKISRFGGWKNPCFGSRKYRSQKTGFGFGKILVGNTNSCCLYFVNLLKIKWSQTTSVLLHFLT